MSSWKPYDRIDIEGQPLRRGDRVLVVAAPTSILNMGADTKSAFSRAIGHTLQVLGFGKDGSLEPDMLPPRFKGLDTIWLEPFLVKHICWAPLPRDRKKLNGPDKRARRGRSAKRSFRR
jgi:hypothetical protein